MSNIAFLLAIILLFLAISAITSLKVANKIKTSQLPYLKKEYLLTRAEKDFYFVLSEILGNDYLIFSKVRMADLLYLPKGIGRRNFYSYQNKIQSKHVDFLICDKANIKPLVVIELDDSSHLKADRISRDELVDSIFQNAKLPIVHIKVSANYDKEDLLGQIRPALI